MLRGKHILIVQADPLMADRARPVLEACGAIVHGPLPSADAALRLLKTVRIDAAILDTSLDGEKAFPLADLLSEEGTPFVFATGAETSATAGRYRGFALCEKPDELAAITVALFAPERFGY